MEIGLYGKLPSHGDFLRRRASDAFVGAWDAWLQASVAASRAALADRWFDVYLTSPAWRFAAAPGACGPATVIGLMSPSVDRVGRCFPLTIFAEMPPHVTPVTAATAAGPFFSRAERLVIETLEAEYVDFEAFDAQVVRLADDLAPFAPPPRVVLEGKAAAVLCDPAEPGCHVPIGAAGQIGEVLDQLFSACLAAAYDPLTMWWTEGSSIVEPSCVLAKGLPRPQAFTSLLEGSWAERRWRSIPARVEGEPAADADATIAQPGLRFRSAAASDVGKVRSINQDSFIEHPDSGLWAVADGVGGHSDGEIASRMVCDALAGFQQKGSFDETIAGVRECLAAVNDQLVRQAARSLLGDRCGSTVVTLLVRGNKCAVLWAGDSRAYRWRSSRLDQLTRDHSLAAAGGARDSHGITRAVGAKLGLELDLCREQVLPGDRYLLCSDGLTGVVPEPKMRACMEAPDVGAVAKALVKAALDAGAPDNVTALVVQAEGIDSR